MGMERRARDGSTKVIPNPPMPQAAVSVAIAVRAWEATYRAKGHTVRGRCVVILANDKTRASWTMWREHSGP